MAIKQISSYKLETLFTEAEKLGHEFLFATDLPNRKKEFHSLPGMDAYARTYSLTDIHAYEILKAEHEVKLYFDIEWKTELGLGITIDDVVASIKKHYQSFFGHELKDEHMMIADASNDQKVSHHLVANNGLYFRDTREIQYFTNYMEINETNEEILRHGWDKGVYTKNRLFRFPNQSKLAEPERPLKMKNGKIKDHLIRRYSHSEFKGYYEFERACDEAKAKAVCRATRAICQGDRIIRSNIPITTDSLHMALGTPNKEREFENAEVNLDNIESMLKCLGNDDYAYQVWFAICCIVKNEGLPYQVFYEWWRTSKTYGKDAEKDPNSTWYSIKNTTGYNIATLRNMLFHKYPNLKKDRVSKLLDQITEPTIVMEKYGYQTEIYCEQYCRPLKPIDTVLRSHLGTGKSTAICDFIKKNNYGSIVCITQRVMFAQFICADFKKAQPEFKLYKDVAKGDRPKEPFIVCQLESLSTIRDSFELVIFDESESNFAQFNSQTMKQNFDLICECFENIMRKAKVVLCADAFVTNRTLCLMKLLRPHTEKLYIQNDYQPYKRVCTRVGKTDKQVTAFFDKFQEDHPNDKNIIMTGSCKNSINLFAKTRGKTILINSYSSDSYATKLQNVNEFWGDARNVIYTPSITVGVSYDPKDTGQQFDNLIMHFTAFSCTVRDMFQGSLRARKIKNNIMYYSHFSSYYGEERPWVFDFDKLMATIKSRDPENKMKDWVKHLWVYNEKELNTNARFHAELIDRYLLICGYTKTKEEIEVDLPESAEEEVQAYKYEDIQRISEGDANEIYIKIVKGEADTIQKLQYIRYTFDHEVLYQHQRIDLEIRKTMFTAYLAHKDKILDRTRNIVFECKKNYIPNRSLYHDNTEQKRESIVVLKGLLGIDNTFDLNQIPSEKIDIVRAYLNQNVDYIQNTWKLTKNFWFNKLTDEPIENKNRRTIGALQTIFSTWCGCDFKKGKRTQKRVNGKRVETASFETVPQPYIKPFIENTKNYIDSIEKYEAQHGSALRDSED